MNFCADIWFSYGQIQYYLHKDGEDCAPHDCLLFLEAHPGETMKQFENRITDVVTKLDKDIFKLLKEYKVKK